MKREEKLFKELKYLKDDIRNSEMESAKEKLDNPKIPIKEIAIEVYDRRGIDYNKLEKGSFNNIETLVSDFSNSFKGKDKKTTRKMILELIYILLIVILLKIPFDLVNDIGYEYIEILSTKQLYYNLWNIGFLILYTITFIATAIVLLRNFNEKYNK